MDQPPKIAQVPAVVMPEREERIEDPPPRRGAPVHPLAALLLLGVDNLWNLADWAVIDWFITIPLSFLTVFVPTFLVQKFVRRDPAGRAFVLAFVLGAVAAVPTSITGTPVGLALLAWFGIDKLIGRPLPGGRT
jgi:hypothetical protein